MSFAMNEVEATAKKATRGAGYPWGLAEEASKATRWLCVQGLDGSAMLANLLEQNHAKTLPAHVPIDLDGEWQGQDDLCPLATGAALSDCAARLAAGPIRIRAISEPIFLLPFAASSARQLGQPVAVIFDGMVAVTDGANLSLAGEVPHHAAMVTVQTGMSLDKARDTRTRANPDPDAWATLNRLAFHTYAPATAESRLLGAGAGLSDND